MARSEVEAVLQVGEPYFGVSTFAHDAHMAVSEFTLLRHTSGDAVRRFTPSGI